MPSHNVHQVPKPSNMSPMDNGKQLEKRNRHAEHNVKEKLIERHTVPKVLMANRTMILINQMTIRMMNPCDEVRLPSLLIHQESFTMSDSFLESTERPAPATYVAASASAPPVQDDIPIIELDDD